MNSISIYVVCLVAISVMVEFGEGHHCRKHDHHCCRKKISYGGCHGHHRRYAYNVSCGQCVPFDYSGCDGVDNNFESVDECNSCCKGTPACPQFKLPPPPAGCHYKWHDDHDGCPRPKLECHCQKQHCRHDSCRSGERCVPVHVEHCHHCPCRQFKCISDPCFPMHHRLRPCEKCISMPAPRCHHHPCPLVAYKENHCKPHHHHHHHHCPFVVECPPHYDSCHNRRCPRHPEARCHLDPCDCRKHFFSCNDGRTYSDAECY